MIQDEQYTGYNEVRIVRGRVDSLSLYEITETELDTLEKGSPYSVHLNFGIFLLTLGFSFFVSLVSANAPSLAVLVVFVVLAVVGIVGGSFLLILWYNAKGEMTDIVKKIRQRIAEQEENAGESNNSTEVTNS